MRGGFGRVSVFFSSPTCFMPTTSVQKACDSSRSRTFRTMWLTPTGVTGPAMVTSQCLTCDRFYAPAQSVAMGPAFTGTKPAQVCCGFGFGSSVVIQTSATGCRNHHSGRLNQKPRNAIVCWRPDRFRKPQRAQADRDQRLNRDTGLFSMLPGRGGTGGTVMDIEREVMRKVAWRLVPFLSLGYLINALDRFNVSIAALTMNKALGLSATTYGLAAGAFFWSYVLFQVPANAILTRIGARRWLAITMITWGACSAGTAFVTDATSFVAMRFALGIAEAGFFPGVAWFMTRWFPSRHRGRAMGIFFAFGASAGIIGGPLSGNL